jgi:hypothetical protein
MRSAIGPFNHVRLTETVAAALIVPLGVPRSDEAGSIEACGASRPRRDRTPEATVLEDGAHNDSAGRMTRDADTTAPPEGLSSVVGGRKWT